MFVINDDLSIYVTRGDAAAFTVTSSENGVNHVFQPGDVVRLKVYGKKDAENIVLQKDFPVLSESETVSMYLSEHDTKFGGVISKPTDYWYEVELNPFTNPQTIIGYDEDGAKVFKLFPEGADVPEIPVDPEVVKVMDDALDLTSTRPVENQAIARAVAQLNGKIENINSALTAKTSTMSNDINALDSEIGVERARIDNLVASAVAPVSGDDAAYLEVADIRVGADGKTYGSAGTAVRTQFASILDKLEAAKADYDETLIPVGGYYIKEGGEVIENETYSISEPIHIKAGYTLTFTARGYKTAVAMISKLNADGTYTPLVVSIDSEDNAYTYTTEEEMDVVFSWSTIRGYSLHINADISKVISVLSEQIVSVSESIDPRVEALLESARTELDSEDYVSLSLFSKFGVIGDSYASGEVYFDGDFHDIYKISWGQILARKNGTNCVNFSGGGYSTRGWLNNSKGLRLMLNTEAQDIYYLCLGINDANYYGEEYLGTVADINEDYTQNPDTFFGNYGRIIGNIRDHAPNAKIVMFTIDPTTAMKSTYNEAIIEIATHFGFPYIVQTDDPFFTSDLYVEGKVQGHPVAVVYSGMATAFERLLKRCIIDNFEYFKDAYMY